MRIVLALLLATAGLVLAAAAAMTVYFRDPLRTTLVLLGAGVLLLGAAGWLARRR
jgi:hypothetical protein